MLLWQLWDYDKLYWDGIPDEVVYAAVFLFHCHLPVICTLWYCTAGRPSWYSFWALHVFHFWPAHRSALAFLRWDVPDQIPDILLRLRIRSAVPHQMQMPLDFFIVGIQSYSSFYDNRMLCFFQCIGWIFCCFLHKWVCKNISQIKCSLHWIVHQNGISCRTDNEFWGHILDLISGFESADRNVVKNDHAYECFIIVTVIYLRLWCRLSIKQSWNCVNENPAIYVTCGRTQYRHLFHNREFHNINCRFCDAFLGCEGQI